MKIKYVFMLALFFFMSFSLHGMQQPNTDNSSTQPNKLDLLLKSILENFTKPILANLAEIKDGLTEMLENPISDWNFSPRWKQASFLTECLNKKSYRIQMLSNWAHYLPFESTFGRATLEMAILHDPQVSNRKILKHLPWVNDCQLFDYLEKDTPDIKDSDKLTILKKSLETFFSKNKTEHFGAFSVEWIKNLIDFDLLVNNKPNIKFFERLSTKDKDICFWYMILLSGIWKENETLLKKITTKFIRKKSILIQNVPEDEKLRFIAIVLESGIWKYELQFKRLIYNFIHIQQGTQTKLSCSVSSDPYSFARSQVPFLEALILSEIWKTDEHIKALTFDFLESMIRCLERADKSERDPLPGKKASYEACKDLKIICAALLESRIFKYDERLKEHIASSINKAFNPNIYCWPINENNHNHALISARFAYAILVFGLNDENVITEKEQALNNIAIYSDESDKDFILIDFLDQLNKRVHKRHADFVKTT